ncbi:FeoA family protein [Tindallia californiensis]|uniref:Ferrous iron transport protein A n=1 Tax=Tindallia californiensis TaxID=159292 RepID=A0A1H3J556_9FIRM|nr:FeoA family protein [Tindallia californiensis]SDY35066.1 ferrous iron transport protein A [Tindallia californiensis]
MSLYTMKKKCQCIIESLPEVPLLDAMGFRKGQCIAIKTKQPFGGPVVVSIGNRSFALARELAEQIIVKEDA